MDILDILQRLESALAEAHLLGEKPTAAALASVEPFCVDTMNFSSWLKWVFLPRMRAAVAAEAWPAQSALLPMAEEAWRGSPGVEEALQLVAQLDACINERSGGHA